MSPLIRFYQRFQLPIWAFLISRLIFAAIQAFALSFPDSLRAAQVSSWLETWVRWDSVYYLSIAAEGYTFSSVTFSTAPFFPLYPILIRLLTPLAGGSATVAALLISNAAALGALIMMQVLAELELKTPAKGRIAALLLLLYPASFFLSAAYTESLFLLLTLASAYCARTQRWTSAVVLGMLASATRLVGSLTFIIVVLEWADTHGFRWSGLHRRAMWAAVWQGLHREGWVLLGALGIPLTLLSFALFQGVTLGSPLAFVESQIVWRGSIDPFKAVSEFLQLITGQLYNATRILGALAATSAVALLPAMFRLRAGYGLYALLSLLIPLSGGFYAYVRYVGVIFPLFIALAGLSAPRQAAIATLFGIAQLMLLWMFYNGAFIA